MNTLLVQIILAGQSDDVGGWMQILVFIVLAVFWLIGGIIKAKANKSGAQDVQSPRKPARRPPVHSRQAREQMLRKLQRPTGFEQGQRQQPRPAARKSRMKFADLQAAVRKFAVEAEQAFQAGTREPVPEHKPVLKEPQIMAVPAASIAPIGETIEELHEKQASEAATTFDSEYLSELLMDYSDTEELRRAILHYEILGRPLSLRDPSESGIGE
jgi:hypothetical protein